MRNRLERIPGATWWMQQAMRPTAPVTSPQAEAAPVRDLVRIVAAQDELPRYAGMTLTEWRALVRRSVATGAYRYPAHVTPPI